MLGSIPRYRNKKKSWWRVNPSVLLLYEIVTPRTAGSFGCLVKYFEFNYYTETPVSD